MAGLKQSRRVSWPTDGNLCKVRLFLSDDAPSQSGLGAEDHLQAKAAWQLPAAVSDDSPPPGFEPVQKSYHPKIDISQIPVNHWQCPPRSVMNPEWHVVAGEESEVVAIENQRQPGVLEAVYPRSSSIPRNPFVSLEVQASRVDDSLTPLIPVIAIEDEDGSEQACSSTLPSSEPMLLHRLLNVGTSMDSISDLRFTSSQSNTQLNAMSSMHLPSGAESADSVVEPDVVAAASAAFTAIVKSSEEGSLVDRDLLIRILNNPNMVEKLVSEYGAPPKQTSLPVSDSQLLQPLLTHTVPSAPLPSLHVPMPAANAPFFHMPHNGPSPALNSYSSPHTPVVPPAVKDVNYYKNLIQLHGGEKQEPLDQNPIQFSYVGGVGGSNQRDPKARVLRPCAYFNTPRGCRHGASCLFQHDVSSPPLRIEQQKGSTKRIKLDGGISRRN